MDTRTRHALKKDKLAQAAASSASWIGEHRTNVLRWGITAAVLVVLAAGAVTYWFVRSAAADTAMGTALDVYTSQLAFPGAPPEPGVYANSTDRAKEANREFVAIAHDFGWLPEGTRAHYFAGVTYIELGQNGPAEGELTTASHSWDRNLANLSKLALAALYHQTGRDNQAVDLYNQVVAKPSDTVSATTAELDLADLYVAQGKRDQARALWAKIQNEDKTGAAGQIAAEKLAGK